MSSRFFAAGNQTESEEENEVVSERSEEEEVKKTNFIYESSSDDDTKRVVRSEKDKRYEALRTIIDRIKGKMRIEDFVALQDEFDDLNKNLEKSKKVIEKEGLPLFYVRICYVLENFLTNLPADKKKSLKPANAKAFNKLKHQVSKNNKLHEEKIKAFAEHPIYSDEESNSEEEAEKKTSKKKKTQQDSDDEWGSSSGEDDDDEEDDEGQDIKKYLQSSDPMVRRNYWLKRETDTNDKDKIDRKEEKKRKQREEGKKFVEDEYEEKIDRNRQKKIYTLDELDKRIVEIVEKRAGRKVTSKEKKITIEEDLDALQSFYDKQTDDIKKLEILLILIPTRTDYSRQNFSQYCMPRNLWVENFENLQEFFKIIKNKKNNLENVKTFQKEGELYYKDQSIFESFSTHFDSLDSELNKALKAFENATPEYNERMKDYSSMIKLADEAYTFFKNSGDNTQTTKFAFKKLEYIYYIPDRLLQRIQAAATERNINSKGEYYQETNTEKTIHELATKVYTSKDNKLIVKTLLYQIYNHAINGRYHTAKEYLLMSHIPEMSVNLEASVQILYNRTLVQLGLCAFSLGLIQEAANALTDIINSLKIRELLGQGFSRYANEKEERRRLLPYHMHINVELVESVFLISTAINEMSNFVLDANEALKKMKGPIFKNLYSSYRNFYGTPETNKDFIMVAAKDLQHGDWEKCYKNLLSTNIWNRLSQDSAEAQKHLLTRVKEQAFKCYLLTVQNVYDSLNIDTLAKQFALDSNNVNSLLSKLVFNREIKAYLDLETNCLVFEKVDINKLESKAIVLADRVSTLLANNEKIMDSKYGSSGITDKDLAAGLSKRQMNKKKIGNLLGRDKRKTKQPKKI